MKIDPSIFKSYDIRGVYPEQLDSDTAYKIGKAYATLLISENREKKDLTIIVSGDMRESTPELKEALIKGLTESGIDVIDIGLASTPTFYFAVAYYKYDGGIQVSASHNPPKYNGFKLVREKSIPISGDTGIKEIKDIIVNKEYKSLDKKGSVETKENVTQKCVEVESENLNIEKIKPFKIVLDPANAMGILDLKEIFKRTNCETVKINFELDGTFPSHPADPLEEENLEQLKEKVLEEKADLGIAVDGDGDRIFFVDEKGEVIRQDVLRGLIAKSVLKENPGAVVAYDIRPGKITEDLIIEAGGKPIVTKVGHSLIKEQMIKENAVYGGESSGHYYFRFDYGTFDSSVQLIYRFLILLSESSKTPSEVVKPYYKYFQSGEINSKVENSEKLFEKLKNKYSDAKEINELDGITIEYDDYWFNVRSSNTEPKVRLNLEAVSKEVMEEKRDEVLELIRG